MTQGPEDDDPLIHEIRAVLAEVDELIDEALRKVAPVDKERKAQSGMIRRTGFSSRRRERIEPLPPGFAPPLHTMSEVGDRLGALAERLEQSLRRPRLKTVGETAPGSRDQQKSRAEPQKPVAGGSE